MRSHGDRRLTKRQRQVLTYVALGWSPREIADRLGIEPSTAKTHIDNILVRLEVTTRAAAVALAIRSGILPK